MTSETKSDQEIVEAYVRGDDSDWWAVEELNELAIDNPERVWKIIQMINASPVVNDPWRRALLAIVGCGPLEEIIALHGDKILPQILEVAKKDEVLRIELSTIYESSLRPEIWAQIQRIIGETTK
jgi:hypothetical protein